MTDKEKKAYERVRGAHPVEPIVVTIPNTSHEEDGVRPSPKILEEYEGGCFVRDSGARTEFPTGAVRDMREGKGRCDLMPLDVVADYISWYMGTDKALPICCIANFQGSGKTIELDKALNSFIAMHPNWVGDIPTMFLEVAKQFEDGAKKYGDSNWQKGVPIYCYIDSAVRHYLKWLRGDKDEPHDRAFVWNIICCIWEYRYSPRAAAQVIGKPENN